jgi:hypothetical protein
VVRGVPDRLTVPEEDHLRRFVPDARLPGDKIREGARFLDDNLPERDVCILLLRLQQLRPSRGGEASGGGVLEEEDRCLPAFFEGPAVVLFAGAFFRHGDLSFFSVIWAEKIIAWGSDVGFQLAAGGTDDIMPAEGPCP